MYFVPFLFALIFMAAVIAFPFIAKMFLKVEGCVCLCSGICCNVLCIIVAGAALGLWAAMTMSAYSKKYSSYTIPFTYTVSEIWRENGRFDISTNIHLNYVLTFLIVELGSFVLILFFVKRAINKITSNRQIFTFISGFNLSFALVFFINMLNSFGAFTDDAERNLIELLDISYSGLIFCFEFMAFSYLLHLSGLVLLFFLWFKNKNNLMLFIAIGASIVPLLFFLIGTAAKATFLSDILTPILFWGSLGAGIFFFIKNGDDNAAGENYVAQPQY